MRLNRLKKILIKKDKLPYLITNLTNISYLTGFKGSYGCVLVDDERIFFITDSRYKEYAESILPESAELLIQKDGLIESLKLALTSIKKKKLHVEHDVKISDFLSMKKELKGIMLTPGGDEVSSLRMIKDNEEIANIRKAVSIADNCFKHLLGIIKPGMLEWDISVEIEYYYRKHGCRKSAFESVVASGNGSSMPHYKTSMTKRIEKGDILLIDMGCEYNSYNSDLTRTIFINNVSPKFEKIFNIVKTAQESAISSVRPGISAGGLDKVARDIITNQGFGADFGHALGHGIGLEVHESPAIKSKNNLRIKKNYVFTIEPGIYLAGSGGVRIEDIVLVKEKGFELLTTASKELIVL